MGRDYKATLLVGYHRSAMPDILEWVDRDKYIEYLQRFGMDHCPDDKELKEIIVAEFEIYLEQHPIGLHKRNPYGYPNLFGIKVFQSVSYGSVTMESNDFFIETIRAIRDLQNHEYPEFMSDKFREFIRTEPVNVINYVEVK